MYIPIQYTINSIYQPTGQPELSTLTAMLPPDFGNSLDWLRHPRSDNYSAEQVLLNKQQIWCGGAYLDRFFPSLVSYFSW